MNIRAWTLVFLRSRFLRIFVIGGIGFLLQTLVFETLAFYLGWFNPSTAAILGGELAILANFSLNERFSFNDRVNQTDHIARRLTRFHITVAGSILIQWVLIFFTEHHTHNILLIHAAYVSGVILGFTSNYIGYHLFVWRRLD